MNHKRQLVNIVIAVVLVLLTVSCHRKKSAIARNTETAFLIGQKFPDLIFLDSAGKESRITFSTNELTIVDFWFNDCPGCLIEMKDFAQLLNKTQAKIQIVSISTNAFHLWKSGFKSPGPALSFLKTSNPSWSHYCLRSTEDPSLGNYFPNDNLKAMQDNFHASTYPCYLVVNNQGQIIETPGSAVAYLDSLIQKH